MKKQFLFYAFAFIASALLFSALSTSAQTKTVASPADSVKGVVAKSTIEIKYGSPSVKGRTIWGELVPYGQIWRAGANKATTFSTSRDIKVEGQTLPAGTYALFAIPTENEWTIVFNKTANQWGAYKYEVAQDALRISVKPKKVSSSKERLVYALNKNGFVLQWGNIEVPVSIK